MAVVHCKAWHTTVLDANSRYVVRKQVPRQINLLNIYSEILLFLFVLGLWFGKCVFKTLPIAYICRECESNKCLESP